MRRATLLALFIGDFKGKGVFVGADKLLGGVIHGIDQFARQLPARRAST